MVVFDKQETYLYLTKGWRMYLYTDEIAVWLFIDIISGTYLRINSYTIVLNLIRDRGPDIPILSNLQALKSSLYAHSSGCLGGIKK